MEAHVWFIWVSVLFQLTAYILVRSYGGGLCFCRRSFEPAVYSLECSYPAVPIPYVRTFFTGPSLM